MVRYFLALASFAVLVTASPGFGAPGDPFGADDAGFIPPDSPHGPITRCENRVAKAVAKLTPALWLCHIERAGRTLADDPAEDNCETAARTQFLRTFVTGCSACMDLAALGSAVETAVDTNNDKVYCTATGTPFGGDDSGNIPSSTMTNCGNRVAKTVGKRTAELWRCHIERASGKLPNDAAEEACETAVLTKFAATTTDGCDPCVNLSSLAGFMESSVDDENGRTYCEGPPPPCVVLAEWGSPGSAEGAFMTPTGVAVDGSGNVFVADSFNQRIQKFTNDGTFLTQWGSQGTGDGQFEIPVGVAVDGSGKVFVADRFNYRVQVFTDTGTFLMNLGTPGYGDGQFADPLGVAVDGSGNVFVTDLMQDSVQKFTNTGTFLMKWTVQFLFLGLPAVDGSGDVYVDDYFGNIVQKFTNDGTFLTQWGSTGTLAGQFRGAAGIAVDGSGNVCVLDNQNGRFQKFTNAGTWLAQCGGLGDPQNIAVDGSGSLFVTESSPDHVKKLAFP